KDVHPAVTRLLDDLLDRRDGVGEVVFLDLFLHWRCSSMRATYRASMSTSRLTLSPGVRAPSVVTASVWGMMATSNQSAPSLLPTPETVSETPSTVMEPFSARYFERPAGMPMRMRRLSPSGVTACTRPSPST